MIRTGMTALAALGIALAAPGVARANGSGSVEARLAAMEAEVGLLKDRAAVEKLTRAFGYYGDKGLWDQVIELFAENCRVEIAGRGAYIGKASARRLFMDAVGGGKIGMPVGRLANHMVLQGIVDVAPDGKTARGRWRELAQVGSLGGNAVWAEGVLQVAYVKEGGVWKFQDMQWFPTFYTPYDQGWGKQANPINEASKTVPPDVPPMQFDIYPGQYVVPFHYPNPVTGQVWTKADTDRYSTTGQSPKRQSKPDAAPAAPVPAAKPFQP